MLEKLYDLFVSIVTFILGLFGFELSKRSVTFAEGTKMESNLKMKMLLNLKKRKKRI